MPNPLPAFSAYICFLARREAKALTAKLHRRSTDHRRSIATLKRELRTLKSELAELRKRTPKNTPIIPDNVLQKTRFRADGLKTHRAKLGISAADYGK